MKITVRSAGYAVMFAMGVIVILTIGAELFPQLKASLASLTGHHWISKGVISLAVFMLSLLAMGKIEEGNVQKMSYKVAAASLVGAIIIFGFYLMEFLK